MSTSDQMVTSFHALSYKADGIHVCYRVICASELSCPISFNLFDIVHDNSGETICLVLHVSCLSRILNVHSLLLAMKFQALHRAIKI